MKTRSTGTIIENNMESVLDLMKNNKVEFFTAIGLQILQTIPLRVMNVHVKSCFKTHSQSNVPDQPISYLVITCIDESTKTIMLHLTAKITQQSNRKSKSHA
jgi:hypothetical protein